MPSGSPQLEVVVTPAPGASATCARVSRTLTTIGSAEAADLRIAGVPERWLILHVEDGRARARVVASGRSIDLALGEPVAIDGATLAVRPPQDEPEPADRLPVERLAEALASVESAAAAIQTVLDFVVESTGAETGAIVLNEGGTYTVAAARDAAGARIRNAEELLSDTVVRDVLAGGGSLSVSDLTKHDRYADVPSVVSLKLRAVACLPLTVGSRILGALYLAKRDPRASFSSRHLADLSVLSTLAVPFLAQLRRASPGRPPPIDGLVGESAVMEEVRRLVEKIGPTDLGVLIVGETGVGKELTARALHERSERAGRPMSAINCSAVPEGLLESELFGAKKGAFTGALQDRPGRIEAAHQSSLFLDEVGDMPAAMQAALLRALEQHEVVRVGDTKPRTVDFRLIAATNKDLDAEVAAGRFREDLLFRIREVTISVPPLRDRGEDILLLARLFLRQSEHQLSLPARKLGAGAEAALLSYPWPGNVRELRAVLRRAAVLCDGPEIGAGDLHLPDASSAGPAGGDALEAASPDLPLLQARDAFVRKYVARAIERHHGDRRAAAEALGISLRSLYRYL